MKYYKELGNVINQKENIEEFNDYIPQIAWDSNFSQNDNLRQKISNEVDENKEYNDISKILRCKSFPTNNLYELPKNSDKVEQTKLRREMKRARLERILQDHQLAKRKKNPGKENNNHSSENNSLSTLQENLEGGSYDMNSKEEEFKFSQSDNEALFSVIEEWEINKSVIVPPQNSDHVSNIECILNKDQMKIKPSSIPDEIILNNSLDDISEIDDILLTSANITSLHPSNRTINPEIEKTEEIKNYINEKDDDFFNDFIDT